MKPKITVEKLLWLMRDVGIPDDIIGIFKGKCEELGTPPTNFLLLIASAISSGSSGIRAFINATRIISFKESSRNEVDKKGNWWDDFSGHLN